MWAGVIKRGLLGYWSVCESWRASLKNTSLPVALTMRLTQNWCQKHNSWERKEEVLACWETVWSLSSQTEVWLQMNSSKKQELWTLTHSLLLRSETLPFYLQVGLAQVTCLGQWNKPFLRWRPLRVWRPLQLAALQIIPRGTPLAAWGPQWQRGFKETPKIILRLWYWIWPRLFLELWPDCPRDNEPRKGPRLVSPVLDWREHFCMRTEYFCGRTESS